ncbi:MAG: alpha/beta fold hydrolase [Spirochaetaceae bacterium]|nr:alpha/beta fold hydrolase [Spirochaetaceae bacterium]MDT8297639.1 alpha/beta fold hydrolase [Spirochaetaceae bacterium]
MDYENDRIEIGTLIALFIIPLAVLIISSCTKSYGEETAATAAAPMEKIVAVPESPPPHPLSIEGLREREYSAEPLILLDAIPAADGLAAREFSYVSEGHTLYGLIEQPSGTPPADGWPVILLAHGYIPVEAYSTMDSYRLVTRYYAAGGFMVVKPDYRGHGRSEGPSESAARTIDYSVDVLNLLSGLDKIPGADTNNVFLYGHSMGGEIGLRILTVNQSLKGATLWAAVTEDFPENTMYFIRRRGGDAAERLQSLIDAEFEPEDYPSLTPNSYLDSISVPLLVHHGTADESVPFEWSVPFRSRMDEAGVDYQFYEYPGEDHNISRSFYSVMDTDMAFFRSLME